MHNGVDRQISIPHGAIISIQRCWEVPASHISIPHGAIISSYLPWRAADVPISIPHGAIISHPRSSISVDGQISIPHGAIISASASCCSPIMSNFNSTWCDYKFAMPFMPLFNINFNSTWCDYKGCFYVKHPIDYKAFSYLQK